jgi:hypothetical protein
VGENIIRCRLKWGDTEFEIEGVVNGDLKKKVDYLYETFRRAITEETEPQKRKGHKKAVTRHGGRKTPFYKSNIQRIISKEPEWFANKDAREVTTKLKTEYGVPGANEKQVGTTLSRLFADGLLTRKEVDKKYLYSITSLEKGK